MLYNQLVGAKGVACGLSVKKNVHRVHEMWMWKPTLEATQGQMYGFFGQLPYKCHQNRLASVGDNPEIDLRFAAGLPPGWTGASRTLLRRKQPPDPRPRYLRGCPSLTAGLSQFHVS